MNAGDCAALGGNHMDEYKTKQELTDTAIEIKRIVEQYLEAANSLGRAIQYLHESQDKIRDIDEWSYEYYQAYALPLARALGEAKMRDQDAVSKLYILLHEYLDAMERVGYPIDTDSPDQSKRADISNETIRY